KSPMQQWLYGIDYRKNLVPGEATPSWAAEAEAVFNPPPPPSSNNSNSSGYAQYLVDMVFTDYSSYTYASNYSTKPIILRVTYKMNHINGIGYPVTNYANGLVQTVKESVINPVVNPVDAYKASSNTSIKTVQQSGLLMNKISTGLGGGATIVPKIGGA